MERSAEERTKYPDRINLDRRGLHGIPLLADEPGLRLLRFSIFFPFFLSLPKTKTKAQKKTKIKSKKGTKTKTSTETNTETNTETKPDKGSMGFPCLLMNLD